MNLQTITDLYRHIEWADAGVWAAVLASANGPVATKLRQYFNHLHLVQHAFLHTSMETCGMTEQYEFEN